jgi:hypothetical protein
MESAHGLGSWCDPRVTIEPYIYRSVFHVESADDAENLGMSVRAARRMIWSLSRDLERLRTVDLSQCPLQPFYPFQPLGSSMGRYGRVLNGLDPLLAVFFCFGAKDVLLTGQLDIFLFFATSFLPLYISLFEFAFINPKSEGVYIERRRICN